MVYLLLAVFAFVALAPLSSVAWKLIDRNREDLKTSEQLYQHLLASTISREVDIHVAALKEQLVRGVRPLALESARGGGLADDAVRRVLDELVDRGALGLRLDQLVQALPVFVLPLLGLERAGDGLDQLLGAAEHPRVELQDGRARSVEFVGGYVQEGSLP